MQKGLEMFNLVGSCALVTGSGRGIGFALARGLGRAGSRIVVHDLQLETAEDAANRLQREGLDVVSCAFDVRDPEQADECFKQLKARNIAPNIIINNAGINLRHPLRDGPFDAWKTVLETHLDGAYNVARSAVGSMVEARRGKIINICSLTSTVARSGIAAYTTAKGGLKMLTKAMAVEWAPFGIQCNGIAPGFIVTDMNRPLVDDEKFNHWVCERTPARRWGQPDELVGAAIYLCSSASDFVTGQVLAVDGGFLASM